MDIGNPITVEIEELRRLSDQSSNLSIRQIQPLPDDYGESLPLGLSDNSFHLVRNEHFLLSSVLDTFEQLGRLCLVIRSSSTRVQPKHNVEQGADDESADRETVRDPALDERRYRSPSLDCERADQIGRGEDEPSELDNDRYGLLLGSKSVGCQECCSRDCEQLNKNDAPNANDIEDVTARR